MTIDIHCHLWMEDVPSRSWWDGFVRVSSSISNIPEEKIRERLPEWMDTKGDLLVSDMDSGGIDKSVLLPPSFGIILISFFTFSVLLSGKSCNLSPLFPAAGKPHIASFTFRLSVSSANSIFFPFPASKINRLLLCGTP